MGFSVHWTSLCGCGKWWISELDEMSEESELELAWNCPHCGSDKPWLRVERDHHRSAREAAPKVYQRRGGQLTEDAWAGADNAACHEALDHNYDCDEDCVNCEAVPPGKRPWQMDPSRVFPVSGAGTDEDI